MASESKHLQVMWSNGMQVSKDHFVASEDAASHQIIWARAQGLNPFNYGLLPEADPLEKTYELRVVSNKAELLACKAVTPGGIGIGIPAFMGHSEELLLKREDIPLAPDGKISSELALVLKVEPFKRKEVKAGESNPGVPLAIPTYSLSLQSFDKVPSPKPGPNELVVGKLVYNGTDFSRDDTYYPPCASLNTYDMKNGDFKKCVEVIEIGMQYCFNILQTLKGNENHEPKLAESIQAWVDSILTPMSDLSDEFRLSLKHQPPVFFLISLTRVARALDNMLKSRPKVDNAEQIILNFLSVSGIIDIGTFRSSMERMLTYPYDHNNLPRMINSMHEFVAQVVGILEKLSAMPNYKWKNLKGGRIVIRDKQDHVG